MMENEFEEDVKKLKEMKKQNQKQLEELKKAQEKLERSITRIEGQLDYIEYKREDEEQLETVDQEEPDVEQ